VRDDNTLNDARSTIERRMEKFKECEKDMKVKNFSRIGLEKGAKQDPRLAAIEERSEWLRDTMDAINAQACPC
jgi:CCR4-NOT transcription complex subunit 3